MESVPSFLKEPSTREESKFTHSKPVASVRNDASELRRIREKEKRFKAIFEDEDLEYEPADEDTIVDRFQVSLKIRRQGIEQGKKTISRARNVQLGFLVDATGSMTPHIDEVKNSIHEIVKKVTDNGPHVSFKDKPQVAQSMEVAFVAYRDHDHKEKQFEVLPFTKDLEKFTAFSGGLSAIWGSDHPEDVFGGIDSALNLGWSSTCGTKVIFHICDFPCHGREFHSGLGDNYPNGDPKGRTARGLFSRMRENGIQYYFGKITDHTDIMINKFSEAYGDPITEFDVKNVKNIRDAVISAVRKSIADSVATSHKTTSVARKKREFTLDKTEPDWRSLAEMKGTFSSYEFPKSIEHIELDVPLERKKPKDAIVKIAKNPFAKGAERLAYYGKNLTYSKDGSEQKMEEDIVFKENLLLGKGMNSASRYQLSNHMNTIVSYLAQLYTQDLKKKAGVDRTIKFIKIRTLALKIDDNNYRFMTSERRFSGNDKFVRFTNNALYFIPESVAVAKGVDVEWVQLVIAFSHWTYKASKRFLMVVDLEGIVSRIEKTGQIGVLLTDPAVHCRDETRYGCTNHGTGGMKNFFARHECNQFCKALGLEGFDC